MNTEHTRMPLGAWIVAGILVFLVAAGITFAVLRHQGVAGGADEPAVEPTAEVTSPTPDTQQDASRQDQDEAAAATAEEERKAAEAAAAEEEARKAQEEQEARIAAEEAYAEVFANYKSCNFAIELGPSEPVECRANYLYAIRDLNADGVNELIVSASDVESTYSNGVVLGVYTLVDGAPRMAEVTWPRSRTAVQSDGTFMTCGSSGAAYQDCIHSTLVAHSAQTVLLDSYANDEGVCSHNEVVISCDEFNASHYGTPGGNLMPGASAMEFEWSPF